MAFKIFVVCLLTPVLIIVLAGLFFAPLPFNLIFIFPIAAIVILILGFCGVVNLDP